MKYYIELGFSGKYKTELEAKDSEEAREKAVQELFGKELADTDMEIYDSEIYER